MMWPRDRSRSHPRRCDSTIQRKFNVAPLRNVCGHFKIVFVEGRHAFKCLLFQAVFLETRREKFLSKQGKLVIIPQKSIFKLFVHFPQDFVLRQVRDEDGSMDPFFRNSLLFRKKTFGSMLDPQRKTGAVCTKRPSLCFNVSLFLLVVWWLEFSSCFRWKLVMMV